MGRGISSLWLCINAAWQCAAWMAAESKAAPSWPLAGSMRMHKSGPPVTKI